jgi:hypothetical protein
MKAKKVNEALSDYLKPKSQEEIKKVLGNLDVFQKIDLGYSKDIDWLIKEGAEELRELEKKSPAHDDKIYKVYSGLDAFIITINGYTFYPQYFGMMAISPEAAKAKVQILLQHLGMQDDNYVSEGDYEGKF